MKERKFNEGMTKRKTIVKKKEKTKSERKDNLKSKKEEWRRKKWLKKTEIIWGKCKIKETVKDGNLIIILDKKKRINRKERRFLTMIRIVGK